MGVCGRRLLCVCYKAEPDVVNLLQHDFISGFFLKKLKLHIALISNQVSNKTKIVAHSVVVCFWVSVLRPETCKPPWVCRVSKALARPPTLVKPCLFHVIIQWFLRYCFFLLVSITAFLLRIFTIFLIF